MGTLQFIVSAVQAYAPKTPSITQKENGMKERLDPKVRRGALIAKLLLHEKQYLNAHPTYLAIY